MTPSADSHETNEWWTRHLETLADREAGLASALESRTRFQVAIWGGLAVLALPVLSFTGWWEQMSFPPAFLVAIGLLVALVAALIAWSALTPMEGRRYRTGSMARWIHDQARSAAGLDLAGGLFPGSEEAWRESLAATNRMGADLSQAVRSAGSADEPREGGPTPEVVEAVARYLSGVVHSDMGWWLQAEGDAPETRRLLESRIRLVFWLWTNRQANGARAAMLSLVTTAGWIAVGLLTLGALMFVMGWWFLLLLPLIAAAVLLKLALIFSR